MKGPGGCAEMAARFAAALKRFLAELVGQIAIISANFSSYSKMIKICVAFCRILWYD